MDVREDTALLAAKEARPWALAWRILLLNGVDSLTFYGISQAFQNFMEDRLGYAKVTASAVRSTWTSLCDLLPLLGAFLGDEVLGRHKSIYLFGTWYVFGMTLLAVSGHPFMLDYHNSLANVLFLVALFAGVSFGNGGLGPNMLTFGADQFDGVDDNDPDKQRYYSQYYFALSLGALFSYAYLAYLSVNGMGALIPASYGYFATFALCACLMLASLMVVASASHKYVQVPPHRGSILSLLQSLWQVAPNNRRVQAIIAGFCLFVLSFALNVLSVFQDPESAMSTILTASAGVSVLIGVTCWILSANIDSRDLNGSKDLTQMVHILPFASFLVLWQCIDDQQDANFQSIGQQCDLRLGNSRDSPQIPGAMLGIFDTIGCLVAIPMLDNFVFPIVESWRGRPASPHDKTFAGFVIAGVAMVSTAAVETWRRNSGLIDIHDGFGAVLDSGTHLPMNNLPWWTVVPNYLWISVSECLVMIPAYEVFYTSVPIHLRSTSQAIFSFMLGMGDNVASIFTLLFAAYIPNDLNHGHMEYMYVCLAILSFANAWCFRRITALSKI